MIVNSNMHYANISGDFILHGEYVRRLKLPNYLHYKSIRL